MPQSLVVDASLLVKLVLPGLLRSDLRTLVTQWHRQKRSLCAPTLWHYEATTSVCKAVYAGTLTPSEGSRYLKQLQALDVESIPPDATQTALAFAWTQRLRRMAAYDSFYLALAETLQCELWTVDRRLCNAVDLPWVRHVGGSAAP